MSCGRPHSYRGSFLEQGAASCKVRLRAKESANCKAHRKGIPRKKGPRPARRRESGEAKGRPSHIGRTVLSQLAGLRDDLLQHVVRNTRNMQVRSSESKHLSVSKWGKFKHWFSHAVPSILNDENLRTDVECRDNECTCVKRTLLCCQNFPQGRKLFSNFPGLQVTWTGGPRYLFWRCKMDYQLRRGYHHPYIGPQSPDIWLLFRIRVWQTWSLFCSVF